MSAFHAVTLELLRPGPPHNQLLSPLTRYTGLCGEGSPVTFQIDLEHREILNRLERLRYEVRDASGRVFAVPDSHRETEIAGLGEEMGKILGRMPSLAAELNRARSTLEGGCAPDAFVHLRVVLSGSELALLPFELAIAPQSFPGEGLPLCLQGSLPVVVTREVRRSRPLPASWSQHSEPRILFVSAEPAGLTVPKEAHIHALRAALEPWIDWPQDPSSPRKLLSRAEIEKQRLDLAGQSHGGHVLAGVKQRLRVLLNASVEDVSDACAAEDYSHVHILAHGAHREEAGEKRFGVALCKRDFPAEREVIDGQRLAEALQVARAGGVGRCQPVVVTLAICDSAQVGSVLVPGGSLAHDLHTHGIPWVFASQFPLTKAGSVRMARFLYPRLLRGDDPRQVLYELRRHLHLTAERDHDWAGIVAYAPCQRELEPQVATCFESQTLLAVEVQMRKADAIAEERAPIEGTSEEAWEGASNRAIEDSMNRAREFLDNWERRLPPGTTMESRQRRTTCFGTRGSVFKRFGLLYGPKDPARAREEFERAAAAYGLGMREWATDGDRYHWVAAQYLSLLAVLGTGDKDRDLEAWTVCRRLAERDLDDQRLAPRAWAHATLAELELIRPWHAGTLGRAKGRRERAEDGEVREKVLSHCRAVIDLVGPDSFQAVSTRRQFQRYVDGWFMHEEGRRHTGWRKIGAEAVLCLSPRQVNPADENAPAAGGS